MKRTALALLLLTIAVPLFAETIRFDPPGVTAHRSVDAIVSGNWPNGCVPSVKNVVIVGSTIGLHLNATPPFGVLCSQLVRPYALTFHLDVLPAGSYTVIAVADQGNTSTELARTPLAVRDAETMNIQPYAVPVSGGPIIVSNPFFLSAVTLTIGGVTVPASSDADGLLIANAPPHAPGAVDVDVILLACLVPCGQDVDAKAGLIYYDPAAADPAVFEPILFPLSFQGPGAFGSQWTTDSFLLSDTSVHFRDPTPCAPCQTDTGAKLANDGNPWGHVLYAVRGTTGMLDLNSRIRDTSRAGQTAGTEVPIVRERDFRGEIRFLNVPVDARYRAMLRVWSLGDFPFIVSFNQIPVQNVLLPLTRIPGTAMWFGSIDVTPLLLSSTSTPVIVDVHPSGFGTVPSPLLSPPIWGMLSITNNDTQQVTIITPH
jgi:hypothetical protein